MDAAEALLKARGIPRQVVVDHQPAELEVDAFAGGFGGDANLARGAEVLLGALPLVGVHAAVDFGDGVAPFFEVVAQVFEGVAVFGEDEQLAAAVGEFVELGPLETFLEGGELGIAAPGRAHGGRGPAVPATRRFRRGAGRVQSRR